MSVKKNHLRGKCQMQKSPKTRPTCGPHEDWPARQCRLCRKGPTGFRDPATLWMFGIVCQQKRRQMPCWDTHTCKCVSCKTRKKLLCSNPGHFLRSVVSSCQHHTLRKMEGQGPKILMWKSKSLEGSVQVQRLMNWAFFWLEMGRWGKL